MGLVVDYYRVGAMLIPRGGSEMSKEKKSIMGAIPSWMLWSVLIIFVVFFVWIVKIAFDAIGMYPG